MEFLLDFVFFDVCNKKENLLGLQYMLKEKLYNLLNAPFNYMLLTEAQMLNNLIVMQICRTYNQEQKLLRQPHKCPPHPPIQCCVNVWKEKIQPAFSNIDHGAGGRPTHFKMAKNVKSLIIFARDCCLILSTYLIATIYFQLKICNLWKVTSFSGYIAMHGQVLIRGVARIREGGSKNLDGARLQLFV
jgi:hypothetical protein